MPVPAPAPTEDDLIDLAGIVRMSEEKALEMVSSPSTQLYADKKWERVLTLLTQWPAYTGTPGEGNLKRFGPFEFYDSKEGQHTKDMRLAFRNRILEMYGYPLLTSEDPSTDGYTNPGSIVSGNYFA